MPTLLKKGRARSKTIPRSGNLKLNALLVGAEARMVLSGFPIETPFTTKAEVDNYLNQPTITCLRCGKEFRSLVNHLWIHEGWNTARYKQHYGVPKTRGLVCTLTHELLAAQINGKPFEKGSIPPRKTGKLPLYRHLALKENAKQGYGKKWEGYERIQLVKDLVAFGCSVVSIAEYLSISESAVRSVLERQKIRLR